MAYDFTKLDNLIKEFEDTKSVPGCSLIIMKDDEILYEKNAGFANIETKKPVDTKSLFRQASTTKLLSYVIFAQLFEEGRFLFSDPVSKYLPEWGNMKKFVRDANGEIRIVPCEKEMTIRHITNLTCGLPYCMFPEPDSDNPTLVEMSKQLIELLKEGVPTLQKEALAMSKVPLMFEPGEHWYYGYGSEIMSVLIEKFEDMPLCDVFKKRIYEPFEMERANTYYTDENLKYVVTNYFKENGKFTPIPRDKDPFRFEKDPVGARVNLLITNRDYSKFMQMLANGGIYKGKRFLAEGTVSMLHENQLGPEMLKDFENPYLEGYGFGFGFRTLITQKYGHNGHLGNFGWTGGTGIWAEADSTDKFSIVYMHNMIPNEELYHHHRVRNVAYSCMLAR